MEPDCECEACGHEWHSSESDACPKCGFAGNYCSFCEQALTSDNSDDVHGDHCRDCVCDRCGEPLTSSNTTYRMLSSDNEDYCDDCMELLHANDY